MTEKIENLVVYTVVMGNDFNLPIVKPYPGVDYVCFSDRGIVDNGIWEIRRVEPLLLADLPRSSRVYKIRPHIWLSDYEKSLYIDSKVQLIGNPIELWRTLINEDPEVIVGLFQHSFRQTLSDEFAEVIEAKLDHGNVVEKQFKIYEKHFGKYLSAKPLWGGIIARRHNESNCITAMEEWYANVLAYSRRDQLSLPISLRHLSANQLATNDASIFKSLFHLWPVGHDKRPEDYFSNFKYSLETERDTAVAELDSIKNSRTWRMLSAYRIIRRHLNK